MERWNANVESVTFHADIESIDRLPYPKASPTDVRAGLCIRRKQPDKYSWCQLHVDGGDDTGETARASRVTYAHEFAHAIDVEPSDTRRLSSDAGWKKAWDAEEDGVLRSCESTPGSKIGRGRLTPQEGFALRSDRVELLHDGMSANASVLGVLGWRGARLTRFGLRWMVEHQCLNFQISINNRGVVHRKTAQQPSQFRKILWIARMNANPFRFGFKIHGPGRDEGQIAQILSSIALVRVVGVLIHGSQLGELPARIPLVRPHYRPVPPHNQAESMPLAQASPHSFVGPTNLWNDPLWKQCDQTTSGGTIGSPSRFAVVATGLFEPSWLPPLNQEKLLRHVDRAVVEVSASAEGVVGRFNDVHRSNLTQHRPHLVR